jgi:hypothetical protein
MFTKIVAMLHTVASWEKVNYWIEKNFNKIYVSVEHIG